MEKRISRSDSFGGGQHSASYRSRRPEQEENGETQPSEGWAHLRDVYVPNDATEARYTNYSDLGKYQQQARAPSAGKTAPQSSSLDSANSL